ncbi:peptidylprolyl isomerase [Wenzhouxiangella sp. EGI_FJ10409]|uniref:peptidylprolyl isomerase n=1 Tax=Wenzhouxiangella sp. EGI_FJ10409 TaxID=3243767 RepID=UPI0035DBF9BA
MNGRRITLLMLTAAILLVGCNGDEGVAEEDRVLARVGNDAITVGEFTHELEVRNSRRPGYYASEERRAQLLEEMIEWQALLAEARATGVTEDPEFRRLVERMIVQRLRQQEMETELAEAPISDADVEAYYREHIDTFTRPERRRIAMLRVDRPGGAEEDAEQARMRIEEARQAAEQLPTETTHFGEVAVEYSDDRSSRYQGGVVGWLVDQSQQRYRWDEEVIDAAFALEETGEISPVVTTASGYYILRLAELEPGRVTPLEQVADGIRHRINRERAQRFESGFVERVRQSHQVEIEQELLAEIPPPDSIPPEREDSDAERLPPAMPAEADPETDKS